MKHTNTVVSLVVLAGIVLVAFMFYPSLKPVGMYTGSTATTVRTSSSYTTLTSRTTVTTVTIPFAGAITWRCNGNKVEQYTCGTTCTELVNCKLTSVIDCGPDAQCQDYSPQSDVGIRVGMASCRPRASITGMAVAPPAGTSWHAPRAWCEDEDTICYKPPLSSSGYCFGCPIYLTCVTLSEFTIPGDGDSSAASCILPSCLVKSTTTLPQKPTTTTSTSTTITTTTLKPTTTPNQGCNQYCKTTATVPGGGVSSGGVCRKPSDDCGLDEFFGTFCSDGTYCCCKKPAT